MIDPLHFKARMKIVPSSRLVGMDNAASGDAMTNDRDGLGLMFHDCRHGRGRPAGASPRATALAALVLASTPIDASEPMICWPDVAAKPPAIDLNDPAQTGRREVRRQSASQFVQQDERGLRMQPEIAAQLKTADALGGVDEQAESHEQRPNRQLSARERGSAGRRELPVADLAFEQPATPISIDGRAAAKWGQIRAPSVSGHRIPQSILCAASSDRSQRSTSDSVLAAADMRKCCATAAVQKKGLGFLRCGGVDVYAKCLIPLLGESAP